jgi:hypothetical protein
MRCLNPAHFPAHNWQDFLGGRRYMDGRAYDCHYIIHGGSFDVLLDGNVLGLAGYWKRRMVIIDMRSIACA